MDQTKVWTLDGNFENGTGKEFKQISDFVQVKYLFL
jgi:hypothetical protein